MILSSDLRAATDLMPHDVCRAIVDGLDDSGLFSEMEITVLRKSTGP